MPFSRTAFRAACVAAALETGYAFMGSTPTGSFAPGARSAKLALRPSLRSSKVRHQAYRGPRRGRDKAMRARKSITNLARRRLDR
jgi:hypothetical protein